MEEKSVFSLTNEQIADLELFIEKADKLFLQNKVEELRKLLDEYYDLRNESTKILRQVEQEDARLASIIALGKLDSTIALAELFLLKLKGEEE